MSGVKEGLLDSVVVRHEDGSAPLVMAAPGPARAAARAELGLPIDRPIVMAGHQAEVWHAGILAKLVAARALARRHDAALVWLVPDQDANEPTLLPYPAQTHEGRLKRRQWQADAGAYARPGTPTGCRPPLTPGDPPRQARTEWPHERARDGVGMVARALSRHSDARTMAWQFTRAALDMASESAGVRVDSVLMASELSRGAAFGMWAERMRREARNCVLAYNAAVQSRPESQVRGLGMGHRWELPLWSLAFGSPRGAVYADDALPGSLAPRALAMTGFARTLLCDAWVMGLGGERYDAVTRRWLEGWMGPVEMVPGVVASATLRLPLREGPLPDTRRASQAAWRVHHARHHPEMLGDEQRQQQRDDIVRQMRETPRGSVERRRLFAALRGVLEESQAAHEREIDRVREEADREREHLADKDCVLDRTWPFALHGGDALGELTDRVRSAVGALG